LSPLVVLTPELLHFSFRWRHRLGNDKAPSVEFTLADGTTIRGSDIRGVFNRIPALPPTLFDRIAPDDRAYALQEWTALHVSWLSALDVPVMNRPVPHGLCGAWRHPTEWIWMASQSGLQTFPFRQDGAVPSRPNPLASRRWPAPPPVLVVDDQVVAPGVDRDTAAACRRLAKSAGTRLLGITLDRATGRFVDASPRPPLQHGGEPLIDALFAALTGRPAS
jgi:hypothetical protein